VKTHGCWGNDFWLTSVSCFVLAIPNRYLPILQEGKIDSLRKQFQYSPSPTGRGSG
jgi:hypothetical protein